jgi:hypothetical protein
VDNNIIEKFVAVKAIFKKKEREIKLSIVVVNL